MSKKRKVLKKKSSKRVHIERVEIQMQPVLVDNFVSLQKVMVNLAGKFDNLNSQLSKLLEMFELSAKALAKKDFKLEQTQDNTKVLDKLSELSEQNKIIAKGLTMLHEAEPAQEYMPPQPQIQQQQFSQPQMQQMPMFKKPEEAYKKSTQMTNAPANFTNPPTFKPLKPAENESSEQ